MRLGVDGDMVEEVAVQMRQSGALQPQTQAGLRTQVQANTGWSGDRVATEIRTLENRAGMLPDQIRAVGAMPVLVQGPPDADNPASSGPTTPPRSGLPMPRPPSVTRKEGNNA